MTTWAHIRRWRPYVPHRWETPFGRFLGAYTVDRLARDCGIDPSSVYKWVSGKAAPNFNQANRVIEVSGGTLDFNAIYGHVKHVRGADADRPAD